ncbi:MAG: hypothetical protein R2991_03255 [Thermoanaerobaculia bacterium]
MPAPEPLLRPVTLPWATALLVEPVDAPAGRWYAALRGEGDMPRVLGLGVLEEFGTLSAPILLAPRSVVGQVYDAGIALAHRRDPELPLDAGWPPLAIGLDLPAPELPEDAEARLLAALDAGEGAVEPPTIRSAEAAGQRLELVPFPGAVVLATEAPLLPRQLAALAAAAPPFAVAVALGNRVTAGKRGRAVDVRVASEATVTALVAATRDLIAEGSR